MDSISTSAAMTKSEVALLGAPDTSDATHHTNASTQAMQISLTNDMLEELLECARSGKPPQILFGSNPVCAMSYVKEEHLKQEGRSVR